jgi:hypothetical protein
MDPDANLAEQRKLAETIINGHGTRDDADRLAELVMGLDDWLTRGGFYPGDWKDGR